MYQVLMASIAILHDCRSVVLFQSGDSRFQIRYMFIGPLDFQTGISEEFAHQIEFMRFASRSKTLRLHRWSRAQTCVTVVVIVPINHVFFQRLKVQKKW
jgi:hypothetical protein